MRGLLTAAALLFYAAVFLYPFRWSLPLRMANSAEKTPAGWRFQSPGLVRSRGPATFDGGRFDLKLRMRSASIEQRGPARIFTISKDRSLRNLTLGQDGADLVLWVRAPGTPRNGTPQHRVRGVFSDGAWHSAHVIVLGETVELFVDGELRLRRIYGSSVTATWDRNYKMAFGNELTGRRGWLGEIEYGGPMERPTHYWTPSHTPRWIPFRETKISDLLINFLSFMPLGLVLVRLGWSRPAALLLAAALSPCTELVQIGLADRFASTTDVLLNASGSLVGTLLVRRPSSALEEKPGLE